MRRSPLRRPTRLALLARHAPARRAAIALALLLGTVQSAALLPLPLLVQHAFDVALPAGDRTRLWWVAAGILLLHAVSEACLLAARRFGSRASKEIVASLRQALTGDVLGRPRAFFDRLEAATLHDRLVHDSERVDGLIHQTLLQIVPATLLLAGLTCVLALVDLWLFLLAIVCLAPVLGAGRWAARRHMDAARRYHGRFAEFSQRVLFRVRYADLVRSDALDSRETMVDGRVIGAVSRAGQTLIHWAGVFTALPRTLLVVAGVAVLIVGGSAVIAGRMSAGQLLAFYAALAVARASMHTISVALPNVIEGWAALGRLDSLARLEAPTPYTGTVRVDFGGRVSLERVGFDYGSGPVLDDVSLHTEPGRIVALVGANGSGKTTLLRLILGWYRPTSGRLLAEGRPFDELDIHALRARIGYVPQLPLVFAGSAAENLAFGLPVAPGSADFLALLQRTGAAGLVDDLRDGLETRVGDDGSGLSGGQRQRLAIARALLREPRLLLLDEPTNHLSPAQTAAVLDRIVRHESAPAVLLVTHDARAVKVADRVFSLEDGRLLEVDAMRPAAGRL